MQRASRFLNPEDHSDRNTISEKDQEVDTQQTKHLLDELDDEAVDTDIPETRSECPTVRPCPYVSCQYNLYLDVTKSGSLKINFDGIAPWEMDTSCALDVAEEHPDGLPLNDVGEYIRLTRERVRQIEQEALDEIRQAVRHDNLVDLLRDFEHRDKEDPPCLDEVGI